MQLVNSNMWWLVLLIFAGLVGLLIVTEIKKQNLIQRLFSSEQQVSLFANFNHTFRMIRLFLLGMLLFLLSFTLLDPRWGSVSLQHNIEGIDIVVVHDISRSMLSKDVIPNRLEYSKKLSRQLLSLVEGNRIGLTAFAGFAFNVVPLTIDIQALLEFLDQMSPDLIDVQGTNLEDAIQKAVSLFQKDALTHKAMVIFTDGEDQDGSLKKAIKEAKQQGIQIFTVAIGTPAGAPIPIVNNQGQQTGFLKKNGKTVVSHLNESLLKSIASETGGEMLFGNEDNIIRLAKHLNEIKASKFGTNLNEFMEPQYQSFLLIAILLLLIYLFLPETKLTKNVSAIFVLMFLILPHPSQAFASYGSQGVGQYHKGNFQKSLESFQKGIVKKPDNDILRFNEAQTYYRLNQKESALKNFLALTNSKNSKVRAKAFYNSGNLFLDNKNDSEALKAYYHALKNAKPNSKLYQNALKNLLYTKTLLKQKKKQQQQNKNNKNDKNKKNKQDKNNKQKKNNKNSTNQNQQSQNTNQQNKQNKTNQNQPKQQQQQKTITPNEVQNLLNLIEQEEKKHLKQQKRKGIPLRMPQNAW